MRITVVLVCFILASLASSCSAEKDRKDKDSQYPCLEADQCSGLKTFNKPDGQVACCEGNDNGELKGKNKCTCIRKSQDEDESRESLEEKLREYKDRLAGLKEELAEKLEDMEDDRPVKNPFIQGYWHIKHFEIKERIALIKNETQHENPQDRQKHEDQLREMEKKHKERIEDIEREESEELDRIVAMDVAIIQEMSSAVGELLEETESIRQDFGERTAKLQEEYDALKTKTNKRIQQLQEKLQKLNSDD